MIRSLVERAAGRIAVMPGGDVTARNAARILAETGRRRAPFRGLRAGSERHGWRNEGVFMGGTLRPPEYDRPVTTAAAIRAVIGTVRPG